MDAGVHSSDMTVATRRRSQRPASEEAVAAARLVLALSFGVGGMAAAIGASTGQPIVVVALPTIVLVIALVRRAVTVAGWAGAATWLCLLPPAHGEAMLAPLAMIVLCVAIAIGPDRLVSLVVDDVVGHHGDVQPRPVQGWIEEDGHRVD